MRFADFELMEHGDFHAGWGFRGDSGGITCGIEMAKSVFGISHEKLLEDIETSECG